MRQTLRFVNVCVEKDRCSVGFIKTKLRSCIYLFIPPCIVHAFVAVDVNIACKYHEFTVF